MSGASCAESSRIGARGEAVWQTLKRSIEMATSWLPPVSRIECIDSCGQPTSAQASGAGGKESATA